MNANDQPPAEVAQPSWLNDMVRIGGDRAIVGPTNWAALSHQQLYDAIVTNNDPSTVFDVSDNWVTVGNNMLDSANTLHQKVMNTTSGWTGDAAEASRDAVVQLVDWGGKASQTAQFMGHQLNQQGQVMATAKANMPTPPAATLTSATTVQPGMAGFSNSLADAQATAQAANESHARAIDVATTMEQSSIQIDQATPEFEPVPSTLGPKPTAPLQPMQRGIPRSPALTPETGVPATPGTPATPVQPSSTTSPSSAGPLVANSPNPTATVPGSPGTPAGQPQQPNYYGPNSQPAPDIYTSPSSYPGGQPSYSGGPASPQPIPAGDDPTPFDVPMGPGPSIGTQPSGVTSPSGSLPTPNSIPTGPYGDGPFGGGPGPAMPGGSLPGGSLPGGTDPMPVGGLPGPLGGVPGGIGGSGGSGGTTGGGSRISAGSATAAEEDALRSYRSGGVNGAGGGSTAAGARTGAGAAGAAAEGEGALGGRGGTGAAGTSGSGSGMSSAGRGGKKEDDKEHKSAGYVKGDDIFEPLGSELAPSVIGERRPKNKK